MMMTRTIMVGRPFVCLLALLAACGQPADTATATDSVNSSKASASEVRAVTTIEIDAGTRRWTAQIADNPSGSDFLAQLPLDLTLTDYAATEKVATLPHPLTQDGAPAAVTPRAGEIGYYAPWGNIALYHKDGPYSPGLVILGRIDEPYADLAKRGPLKVTIRRQRDNLGKIRPSE